MRYIDMQHLRVDGQWEKDAGDALAAVRDAAEPDKSAVIAQYQHIWKALKDALKSLSHHKCWYCESIEARSDNAVDHYRPKGNVRDAIPPHKGYWWLAFDWRNYRFTCTYCNSIRVTGETSGGKQDYFPLSSENNRARSFDDSLTKEDPLLLDPTNPLDVMLIAFADDGSAGPAIAANDGAIDNAKGVESVKRYHLNQPILVELRLARILQVRGWLEEADDLLKVYKRENTAQARASAKARLQDIIRCTDAQSPYSSAVKHFLAGMKGRSAAASAALS
jgi:hypothetical protein